MDGVAARIRAVAVELEGLSVGVIELLALPVVVRVMLSGAGAAFLGVGALEGVVVFCVVLHDRHPVAPHKAMRGVTGLKDSRRRGRGRGHEARNGETQLHDG